MKSRLKEYCDQLDAGVDQVRALTRNFRESLCLSGFAYVRVYHDGRVGWVTSEADHDRFLVEKGFLDNDPLLNTAQLLKEGHYLWFHDRLFPGCESFYRDRSRLFGIDHGLVIVNHQQKYLETACFSGGLAKRPLYNLFMNQQGIFYAFMEHIKGQFNRKLNQLLDEGLVIADLKTTQKKHEECDQMTPELRRSLIAACGWSNLLLLSPREKECLALLQQARTYAEIGKILQLSHRTIEHYVESIKNKLVIHSRAELHMAAQKLVEFGL